MRLLMVQKKTVDVMSLKSSDIVWDPVCGAMNRDGQALRSHWEMAWTAVARRAAKLDLLSWRPQLCQRILDDHCITQRAAINWGQMKDEFPTVSRQSMSVFLETIRRPYRRMATVDFREVVRNAMGLKEEKSREVDGLGTQERILQKYVSIFERAKVEVEDGWEQEGDRLETGSLVPSDWDTESD
jgi:hypothetical protein